MIVITGDHEGLASERPALASSAAGRGLVSEGRFTPLIVVNAPAAMRCTDTVGQIDIYPTLLDCWGSTTTTGTGWDAACCAPMRRGRPSTRVSNGWGRPLTARRNNT